MTITAMNAKELTIKAIEEREAERNATAEFIINEYIEPAIKDAAEDGKYCVRVQMHNIDRGWRLSDHIVNALSTAGYKAQTIAQNKEIDISWR